MDVLNRTFNLVRERRRAIEIEPVLFMPITPKIFLRLARVGRLISFTKGKAVELTNPQTIELESKRQLIN